MALYTLGCVFASCAFGRGDGTDGEIELETVWIWACRCRLSPLTNNRDRILRRTAAVVNHRWPLDEANLPNPTFAEVTFPTFEQHAIDDGRAGSAMLGTIVCGERLMVGGCQCKGKGSEVRNGALTSMVLCETL